jgi:SOS-response transcriptional repressor LexA|tara:strand:+ start:299 stop:529 length:231 start_codon:yes stop_codon:yes gene_type:complete
MKTTPSKRPMTPNMRKLLQFISEYYTKHEYMPTYDEMRIKMGYKSKNSISMLIEKLEQRKDIKVVKGYRRNIELNG